jgi:FKBP-type peptidyl-prolyl cis-trans isomerase FkpA
MEGIAMMAPGDSAIFRTPVDTLLKVSHGQLPAFMKAGDKLVFKVVLVSVVSKEEKAKEDEKKSASQKGIDDKILQDYFAKNNLKPTKTASGMYYSIEKEGTGENAKKGQDVTVNYTGKTLDGKTFDSNVDSNFHHVQPFNFPLGEGHVIKGWDEGVALLKKGSQATLYIPSPLAYGARQQGPIPANGILIFTVEVTDIKVAADHK